MSYKIHDKDFGNGGYTYSYMGLPFKIKADTATEAEEVCKAFSDHMDKLLKDHPQVVACKEMSDCIACFSRSIEIAEAVRN